MNPDIVTGISMMLLFVFIGAILKVSGVLGFTTMLIAHITFELPYVILNILPRFRSMDRYLTEAARPTYNEDDYESAGSPVALTFEYGLVNDFLSEWCEMKTKLNNGEISPNEYFEWKITWPQA